jgi:hypothetical protein
MPHAYQVVRPQTLASPKGPKRPTAFQDCRRARRDTIVVDTTLVETAAVAGSAGGQSASVDPTIGERLTALGHSLARGFATCRISFNYSAGAEGDGPGKPRSRAARGATALWDKLKRRRETRVAYGRRLRFGRDRGAAGRRVRPAKHDRSGSSSAGQPTGGACFPQARLSAWLGKATAPSVSRGRGGPAPPRRRPARQPRPDPEAVERCYTTLIGASPTEPTSMLPVWVLQGLVRRGLAAGIRRTSPGTVASSAAHCSAAAAPADALPRSLPMTAPATT